MIRGAILLMCVLGLLLVAGVASAGTSSPSTGHWAGSLRAVKPATNLTFSVTASGAKRAVRTFQSTGLFKAPCVGAGNTAVPSIPHATVNSAGSFKAVARELAGFGKDDTWTVAGRFKSKHAASGTVAIVLALSPSKRCRFTVKWSATYEALAAPVAGATYKGTASGINRPVSFHVSANGKELTKVSWREPLVGGTCPGQGSEIPTYTGHNVPIHHGTFTLTIHSGKISQGETETNAISGRFLSGHKASGTASTVTDLPGFGSVCRGSESWIAQG